MHDRQQWGMYVQAQEHLPVRARVRDFQVEAVVLGWSGDQVHLMWKIDTGNHLGWGPAAVVHRLKQAVEQPPACEAVPHGKPSQVWPAVPSAGMKQYQAVVWLAGQSEPGKRVTVVAKSPSSARAQLVQAYGNEAVITLLDDVDLRPRQGPTVGPDRPAGP